MFARLWRKATEPLRASAEAQVASKVAPLPEPRLASPDASPGFRLSRRSLSHLDGVHKDLQKLVKRALQLSSVDFTVIDGMRTREEQRELVASGASKTLNSRHLTGHAVDVVPYVDGAISWDWDDYYPMADAFIKAAKELDIKIRWGGNWQVNDIRTWKGSALELNQAYTGNFPDGPHFEIPR